MNGPPQVVVFDPLSWVSDFDYEVESELLEQRGVQLVVPGSRADRDELIRRASVVIAAGLDKVTREEIATMESCVGIVAAQAGLDHIDLAAAESAGLPVLNLSVSTEEVADHAMALMLAALRRIVSLNEAVQRGSWNPLQVAERGDLRRLRDQTLGVIGPGRVGRAVAARARPFGFKIFATGRRHRAGSHKGTLSSDDAAGINHVPLGTLLEHSDVIVVCADANPSSVGLLGVEEFARMRDGVILVNVSRGSLIDEQALAGALDRGKVALAALDVRNPEPPDAMTDPLRNHPKVVQTPHIAGASRESRRQMHSATAERALDLLERAGLVEARPAQPDGADLGRLHHLDELEDVASSVLPGATYGYVAGGAGLEGGVSRNRESLDAVRLVPRIMRDVREVTHGTSLLGEEVAFPLVLAPSAVQRLAHPEGELATARAARQAGLLMILSMNASTTMEEVAAQEVAFWMQLYVSPDRGHMEEILQRAAAAGAKGLCLTVDHAGTPTRLRELHQPLVIPPEVGFAHLAEDPALRGIDRGLTWDAIDWIRSVSSLPIVLKGVLHPDDVRIAADHGVDAVVVSNHGGRQLDGTVSAYDVIGPILEANAGRMEVLADGGIRSGTDLLKVLALGARAGLIGRPVWWGLAAAGEAGVRRVIELVTLELVESMRLCGVSSVGEITGEILLP